MLKHRVVGVGVVVALILLTVGGTMTAQGQKPLAGVTITVASIGDPYAYTLNKIIAEFTDKTGIKVRNEIFDYDNGRKKQLLDATSKSQIYDIYSVDVPWVGEFDNPGYVEPLTNYLTRDAQALALADYPAKLLGAHKWKGVQYQIPVATGVEMLFYRKDLFEKDGIKPPETTDDFLAAAKHFTKKFNPDSPTEFGTAENGQKGAAIAQQWMSWNSAFGGAPIIEKDGTLVPNVASPAGIKAAEFMKSLLPYMPPEALSLAWDSVFEEMAQGRVALVPMWSNRVFLLEDPKKSKVVGRVGYAVFPHALGVPSRPGLGGYGFGISSAVSQQRKDAAWEFIKWLASKEGEVKLLEHGDNSAANRYSSLKNPDLVKQYPNFPVVLKSYELSNYDFRTRFPIYNTMSDALGVEISEMMLGQKPAPQALDAVQQTLQKAISR